MWDIPKNTGMTALKVLVFACLVTGGLTMRKNGPRGEQGRVVTDDPISDGGPPKPKPPTKVCECNVTVTEEKEEEEDCQPIPRRVCDRTDGPVFNTERLVEHKICREVEGDCQCGQSRPDRDRAVAVSEQFLENRVCSLKETPTKQATRRKCSTYTVPIVQKTRIPTRKPNENCQECITKIVSTYKTKCKIKDKRSCEDKCKTTRKKKTVERCSTWTGKTCNETLFYNEKIVQKERCKTLQNETCVKFLEKPPIVGVTSLLDVSGVLKTKVLATRLLRTGVRRTTVGVCEQVHKVKRVPIDPQELAKREPGSCHTIQRVRCSKHDVPYYITSCGSYLAHLG